MASRRAQDRPLAEDLTPPERVNQANLNFDPNNPRIQRVGDDLDQTAILTILWQEYSVDEVAMSIAHNGFFEHEPLFVATESEKLIVIEGNRRLAAVRILRDPSLRHQLGADDLPRLNEKRLAELTTLPVIHCRRRDIWRFIGFKHVNGPQVWNSYAKAEYIAWVRNSLGTDLTEIARTIGDTHTTVARLYRAFTAIRQAEESGVYSRASRVRKHFSFSHLYTGLDYPGIKLFTGVSDVQLANKDPIPETHLKQFGELCAWLWGDKERAKPALIKSQNPDLRRLDEALQHQDGITALRAGYDISVAVDIARGDTALFRESLLKSKRSLQEARARVVTGFAGERDLIREMEQIIDLVEALDDDMQEVLTKRRTRRRRQRESDSG